MNIFLICKGYYVKALKGPEMRYIGLGKALNALGHDVLIAGKQMDTNCFPKELRFVSIHNIFSMVRGFVVSDCIVLHGGGPFILLLSLIVALFGKKIVLDGYVPHWIELDEVMTKQGLNVKLSFKSAFNAYRGLMALLVFDLIIVGNQRQEDLMRGLGVPFFRTKEFHRIQVIPFGCDPYIERPKCRGLALLNSINKQGIQLTSEDFLIGWLGGTYGWFDLKTVLRGLSSALEQNNKIKIVFFGVDDERQAQLLSNLPVSQQSSIIFLPWVPFEDRFDYWAAFDVSLVWGANGYENQYASRTRNFDSLSLGLPIIQNKDDEWGPRLIEAKAGVVTTEKNLSLDLLALSNSSALLSEMKENMVKIVPEFCWEKFATKFLFSVKNSHMSFVRRMVGLFGLVMILPIVIMFFIYNLFSKAKMDEKF